MVIIFLFILLVVIAAGAGRRPKDDVYKFDPPNVYGKTDFATDDELREAGVLRNKNGLPIGSTATSEERIFFNGPTSLISFGGTGSGKTTSSFIPAALTWRGSLVNLDMTGETTAVTSERRADFGDVVDIVPYGYLPGQKPGRKVRYNAMDRLNPKDVNAFGPMSRKIAESCIRPSLDKEKYWYNTSIELGQGVIMGQAECGKPEDRNLTAVARIISGDVYEWARSVVERVSNPLTKAILMRYAVKNAEDRKSLGEVVENTRTEMSFLLEPAIAETVSTTDVPISRCKKEVTTINVFTPASILDARFLRHLFGSSLAELLQPGGDVRTLILADEYFSLRLSDMEQVVATARKYKTQVWLGLQDLSQLKELHLRTWETFIANAGCVQWLSAHDLDGSTYLSNLCGDTEIHGVSKSVSYSTGSNKDQFNVNESMGQSSRKLVLPHEIRQMSSDNQIVFMDGVQRPLFAKRKPYFKTSLRRKAQPNPFYKKSFWESMF